MRTRLFAILSVIVIGAVLTAGAGSRMSYIYKRGDTSYMRGMATIKMIERIGKRYGGEYIWVEQDGRRWLIRDAAVLAEARELFRELDAFAAPLEAVQKRLRPFERKYDEFERRADAISDAYDEDLTERESEALQARLEEVEKEMEAVEREMRVVEREMERLEQEMEKLEEVVERKFEQLVARAIRSGAAQRE